MSVCKKIMTFMASCLLLVTVFSVGIIQTVATGEPNQLPVEVFDFAGAQVSADVDGNYALRFVFKLGCTGVRMDDKYNTVIQDDAKVSINGQVYPLVGFGANVALDYDTTPARPGACVPAKKLYDINDNGTVTYTARVTGLTVGDLDTSIYAKAYILYRDGDEIKTHTTQVFSRSYRKTFFEADRDNPKAGDVLVEEMLILDSVTVDLETNTGTMVVKNISKGYETDQAASYLLYTFYDINGVSLGDVRINIGRIRAGRQSGLLGFTLPDGAYSMRFKKATVETWTDGWR